MLRRRCCLGLLAALIVPVASASVPPPALQEWPAARLQGSGRMRFMGLRVYEARLWSESPVTAADWPDKPLLIEIEYARSFTGRQIAERSLSEMRRQREISVDESERWLPAMQRLFPDVQAGDRISGLRRPGETSRFHVNGRFVGEVRDPAFARLFFGIWLSAKTSEPALRAALLGAASRGGA